MYDFLEGFIRDIYETNDRIYLHQPVFIGNEASYVQNSVQSTIVSSIGKYVDKFEFELEKYTNSPKAVVTVNGTSALHLSLLLADVKQGDYVITQSLTFIATCNAINYCGAKPILIDVDIDTLGLSPSNLKEWLSKNAYLDNKKQCRVINDNEAIKACLPMHTFGHSVKIDELALVCKEWNIPIIEDAAESLGSFYKNQHLGTFGKIGSLSFNGNKIITTGGGGAILTDKTTGERAKHLSTTAKKSHKYEYDYDEIGFNYRMPNLNAALGCAQIESIERFVKIKRNLAQTYKEFFKDYDVEFFTEPQNCRSNYWLNTIILEDRKKRDEFLNETIKRGIMTRPIWKLMDNLPMYQNSLKSRLDNSKWLEDRVVNIPSGIPISFTL
jgi:aminotransferase in exopolysaccharide biosynthesis